MKIPKPGAPPPTSAHLRRSSSSDTGRSLRARLDEAEQTLAAIRTGEVDALVAFGPLGDRVFTLEGAQHGYRVLMEAMSEGVATLTEQGLITYCNARFAAIVGAPLERTIGSPISRFVPAADKERFEAIIAAGAQGRAEGEFWLQAPNANAPTPVRIAVVSLTMDGARTHCLVMTDLTEQCRLNAAMEAERAQMQMRLLLADRMSSLGTLAAGVAHEINNPLASVITGLELIRKRLPELSGLAWTSGGELPEWMGRQVERASEGAERVRLIVRGLKGFSKADDETMGVVDPRRALDTAIALVGNEVRLRARLVKDYDALPAVWANEARLEQVFVNLLTNAAQAIPSGRANRNAIRVSGYADPVGQAVVEIHDSGTGIPPENLTRIFEPFFTTKSVGTGAGLGLALCHGIVSSLGGQITVESAPGRGTVFRVLMPALPAVSQDAQSVAIVAKSDSRGRLLVIDDEQDLCELVQEALAPFHDAVTTTDARVALEWISAGERFDMIVCDIRMPEMTGIDFYTALVATHPEQASRVVLMSGGYNRQAGDSCVALPSPILEKPFQVEQVLALMLAALRRGPRPPGAPTQWGLKH
jgi:signal transduction histidine kinase/CheY-like chemotaxis protein